MVFLITLILLGDLGAAFLVFLMVALTDVAILAAFVVRGLSIEFISALVLVLAVGFSVDYSAHIAHAFIHSDGVTGDDRARDALAKIGKSVICGGFSTWLAVVLLPFSNSYLFKEVIFWSMTFTVGFGMFHGMLVLPVLLSLIHDGRQWWCDAQYPIDRGWGEVAGAKSTTKRSTTPDDVVMNQFVI
jgi:multidrug efflux pump subunit AcrB